jgi:hypothetical protein
VRWKRKEKGSKGIRNSNRGSESGQSTYSHAWKSNNESVYFVQLIYANKTLIQLHNTTKSFTECY